MISENTQGTLEQVYSLNLLLSTGATIFRTLSGWYDVGRSMGELQAYLLLIITVVSSLRLWLCLVQCFTSSLIHINFLLKVRVPGWPFWDQVGFTGVSSKGVSKVKAPRCIITQLNQLSVLPSWRKVHVTWKDRQIGTDDYCMLV